MVYVRISRDRAGESLGVQRQEEECRELCARNGWHIVVVLVDNDVSAYSGKRRPGYERLLELIGAGDVDVVVAWNTDRLHRRLVELITYTEACAPRNVTTHTVRTGPIDLSTPSGILVAQQLGAVAEYESRNKSARIRAAKQQRATMGVPAGGPRPFGWEPGGVTPRAREADAIVDATHRVIRGESLYSITQEWRAAELLTSHGKPMYVAALRAILLRARNAGLRDHRGVVVGRGSWEPIVDPEDWHACRRVITDPARKLTWSTRPKYLGAMRYRCGALLPDGTECGFPLKVNGTQVRKKYGSKYRYRNYVCTRDPKMGVSHVTARQESVDEYVVTMLLAGMKEHGVDPTPLRDEADSASLSDEVAEIESAQAALASELAAGRLPAAAFAAANEQLAERMTRAQSGAADAAVHRAGGVQWSAFDEDPRGTFDAMSLDEQRDLLGRFVTVTVLPASSRSPRAQPTDKRVRFDWNFDDVT